ncbi:MAG: hypothetical protein IJG15_06895 [Lachnospiraceae bacterium]|nr:hypothetical protein [Lachnospiraceae bacterium]
MPENTYSRETPGPSTPAVAAPDAGKNEKNGQNARNKKLISFLIPCYASVGSVGLFID